MMPDICLDAYNLSLARGTGIATYTRNLLEAIQALGHRTHAVYGPGQMPGVGGLATELAVIDTLAVARKPTRLRRWANDFKPRRPVLVRPVERTGKVIWPDSTGAKNIDQVWAAEDVFRNASRLYARRALMTEIDFPDANGRTPDLMHWTSVLPLACVGRPNIYTIHDLIPLKLPETTAANKQALLSLCQTIAARADHIVTVSESARTDIIEMLGVSEDRVTNTYQAVTRQENASPLSPPSATDSLETTFGLEPKGYYLFYGAIEPKKNVLRLIEAYIASGVSRPLIIVGPRGWLDDREAALLSQIERDGADLSRRIRRYEYLPRSLLMDLVRGARATVFPSIYEGFGLPVLESMMEGTAVMTSNTGALREISGDAALGVDPYDVASIANGFRVLENDADIVGELEKRGPAQAALFSAARYRDRLRDLYAKLV